MVTNNQVKWLELHIKARFDKNYHLIDYLAIGRDITESKELESSLLLLNQRHEAAEFIANVSNWEYNISEDTFLGSKGALRLYGFPITKKNLSPEDV